MNKIRGGAVIFFKFMFLIRTFIFFDQFDLFITGLLIGTLA